MRYPVFLALVALSVPVEAESPSQLKSSVRIESIKRRGNHNYPLRMAQRGRKKSIWSYNPGHRSLAFLIAGEVAEVSPPPVDPETGMEYRCLGCCGASASVTVKTSISLELSNSVGQIVSRTEGIGALGTEPNAINDRCLGCCHKSVTPRLGVTPETRMSDSIACLWPPITDNNTPTASGYLSTCDEEDDYLFCCRLFI
ncbi:uncharacterized protein LOC142159420 isoform X2 [Mixophyes fleayi]|uniref:uncharacterized protein LOC142159420 isoform X2 n=1 Tax=Mixophyes fleayi TaxID=3061075 RepID=UPI003F4DA262